MGGEISPGRDSGALLRLRAPGDQRLDGATANWDGLFKGLHPPGRMVVLGKGPVSHGIEIAD